MSSGPSRRPAQRQVDAVLRPHRGWAVANLIFLLIGVVVFATLAPGSGWDAVWLASFVLVPGSVLTGALRERVVLVGPVLHRRGVLRWHRPLAAGDVQEVTLHRETTGRLPDYHLVLALNPYGPGQSERFSLRWWNDWSQLIGWLVRYCTRFEDGELVWAVKTDEKTRGRLQPIAQPHLESRT